MPTILVVDDQPESRRPIEALLRAEGYAVLSADNAYAAMAVAKRRRPDLILLDVMIPPMDGLTFLMLLRDEVGGRDLPVIVISGLSDGFTATRAKDLGVRAYLVKSCFEPHELLALVRENLTTAAEADPAEA